MVENVYNPNAFKVRWEMEPGRSIHQEGESKRLGGKQNSEYRLTPQHIRLDDSTISLMGSYELI